MLSRQGTPLEAICIGIGGPSACRWTKGRARLYSQFRVFTRYRRLYVPTTRNGGFDVVRALTLSTRARPGFARIVHHYGDDYAGWPADYFIRHVTVLATDVQSCSVRPIGRSDRSAPEGSRVRELHRRLAGFSDMRDQLPTSERG